MSVTSVGDFQLPLRQSCDRCHGQKVRCMRDPEEDPFVTTDEASRGEATAPCSRCKKAGVACTYSPQLRSGRPSTRRDPSSYTTTPRKRPCTADQSCSPLLLSLSQPLPTTLTPSPDVPLDPLILLPTIHTDDHSEYTTTDHENNLLSENIASYGSEFSTDLDVYPLVRPIMATYLDGNTTTGHADQTPSITAVPEQEPVPELELNPAAHTVERTLEELAELSQRCCRATRLISASGPTALSVTSSGVNEVADVTSSLVNLVTRLIHNHDNQVILPDVGHFYHPSRGIDLSLEFPHCQRMIRTPDTGISLMILACYQRLVVAFERICSLIHLQLEESNATVLEPIPQLTPPRSLRGSESMLGSTTQAVMITKLISYLLHRLDRALVPLAAWTEGKPQIQPNKPSISSSPPLSGIRSELPRPREHRCRSYRYDSAEEYDGDNVPPSRAEDSRPRAGSSPSIGMANSVINTMQRHRARLKTRMVMIERLIEVSEVV
jgi:hypothetical protein